MKSEPDDRGHFGPYGGRFVPETLIAALDELAEAYPRIRALPEFQRELGELLTRYAGRPTPLYHATNLTRQWGGAQVYLKREDLAHTGAHKINNALGQAQKKISPTYSIHGKGNLGSFSLQRCI